MDFMAKSLLDAHPTVVGVWALSENIFVTQSGHKMDKDTFAVHVSHDTKFLPSSTHTAFSWKEGPRGIRSIDGLAFGSVHIDPSPAGVLTGMRQFFPLDGGEYFQSPRRIDQ